MTEKNKSSVPDFMVVIGAILLAAAVFAVAFLIYAMVSTAAYDKGKRDQRRQTESMYDLKEKPPLECKELANEWGIFQVCRTHNGHFSFKTLVGLPEYVGKVDYKPACSPPCMPGCSDYDCPKAERARGKK